MPSKDLEPIKAHVSKTEKAAIKKLAAESGLSVSSYLRHIATNRPIPDAQKLKDIKSMARVAGDLARLGNLFKMALNDEDFTEMNQKAGVDKVLRLLEGIEETKNDLHLKIKEIKAS